MCFTHVRCGSREIKYYDQAWCQNVVKKQPRFKILMVHMIWEVFCFLPLALCERFFFLTFIINCKQDINICSRWGYLLYQWGEEDTLGKEMVSLGQTFCIHVTLCLSFSYKNSYSIYISLFHLSSNSPILCLPLFTSCNSNHLNILGYEFIAFAVVIQAVARSNRC